MKNFCFQTSGGHCSVFVAMQFRCCYVLCKDIIKKWLHGITGIQKIQNIFMLGSRTHPVCSKHWLGKIGRKGGGETGETNGKQEFVGGLEEMCLPILQVGAGDLLQKEVWFLHWIF